MTSPARARASTVIPVSVATGLFALYCLVLAVSSSPRRVGDGVEYWAMAEQMRMGRRPSATRADLARLERDAQTVGRAYDRSPVRFPHLVGADGRQDFPHFWLYPLVNVPALALVTALGIHPNWAFTLTNIVLLALAFAIVARRVSAAWALLILAGPLIWWIDKAHGDVFTVSLLAVACALWHAAPAWAVTVLAVAAAQNPALMPVWGVATLVALWPVIRGTGAVGGAPGRDATDETPRRLVTAVAVSAAIVALPLAYYKSRLGVWSPLIGYTHLAWPSVRAIVSLIADPNIGLLPNAPCVAVAGVWAIATVSPRGMRDGRDPGVAWWGWALAASAWVLMLAAFAQSVNLNHGATPGMNRWMLWLVPWLLLFIGSPAATATRGDGRDTTSRRERGARLLVGLAVLHMVWAVWFFRPSLPEVYRYPTRAASWLWTNAPSWYAPAPEIFAERVSHREAPPLPVAWPGCTIVLIVDGRWPAQCVPSAPAPATCLGPDRLCYATTSAATTSSESTPPTTFTPLGVASFPWAPAARSWSGDAPFLAALRDELTIAAAAGAPGAPSAGALQPAEAVVRAMNGVGWANVWSDGTRLAIYVEDVSPDASLDVRVDADYGGQLIDLETRTVLASLTIARSGGQPSVVLLPVSVRHGLLRLDRRAARAQ